jgi:CRP-like cAMP-binding protein
VSDADLKRLQLLSELQHQEREAIADALEPLRLEAGTLLFDEGEQGEGALFLVEGDVELSSSRTAGRVALGAGAALGPFALVAAGPREARAETTSRCELLVLRRSAFRRFADQEPRAACRLLEAILRETSRLGREALALTGPGVDPPTGAD